MEVLQLGNLKEIKKAREELEKKLNVKITLSKNSASIEGNPMDEYEASMILEAISFGFSAKKALLLIGGEVSFRKISIKDFTKRKNLHEVRARVIGKEGKVKRTLEDLSDCEIIVRENTIGILGSADSIDIVITALSNLIRGSKAANVYSFLEKINRTSRKFK